MRLCGSEEENHKAGSQPPCIHTRHDRNPLNHDVREAEVFHKVFIPKGVESSQQGHV